MAKVDSERAGVRQQSNLFSLRNLNDIWMLNYFWKFMTGAFRYLIPYFKYVLPILVIVVLIRGFI